MQQTERKIDSPSLASLRREILTTQFGALPRDPISSDWVLGERFSIEPERLPAIRAWLTIEAKRVLQSLDLDEKIETDLKLLALHYVNSKAASHSPDASMKEIRTCATRLGINAQTLKDAVLSYSRFLTHHEEENRLLEATFPARFPSLERSPSDKRMLRRMVLQELALCKENNDSEIAEQLKVPKSTIPAVRAWVGKIFLSRICMAEKISLSEEHFPEILKVAAWLNRKRLEPAHTAAAGQVSYCATKTGLLRHDLDRLLCRFLERF